MQSLERVENLRDQFETSEVIEKLGLNFAEYETLFRVKEGVKFSELFAVLYCSPVTVYRHKRSIIKKFKATTFEQAIYLAVQSKII